MVCFNFQWQHDLPIRQGQGDTQSVGLPSDFAQVLFDDFFYGDDGSVALPLTGKISELWEMVWYSFRLNDLKGYKYSISIK